MTLMELSTQYRDNAQILSIRIGDLRHHLVAEENLRERCLLEERIHTLSTMQREARELASLMERYYDRGYSKNGKYTI